MLIGPVIGWSSKIVAGFLATAIDKYDKSNPRHLKSIEVYVFQEKMLHDFQQALLKRPVQTSKFFNTLLHPMATIFSSKNC